MIVVDRQVHGYRQGHQLLATSTQLPKTDQSVIDRLSDVAGPLRPREQFKPYLSVYPLPSGKRVVLARTWQDTTVSRAGCVRTLSLLIGAEDWAFAESLSPFLDLLEIDGLPGDEAATRQDVSVRSRTSLPPVPGFKGGELIEALFLEETRPVVVFDAPTPDLIALRLLSALWPSARRRFALSTFALSPRKVGARYFDLVFAPKDARGKFSDWGGRRIDGHSSQDPRHRWTGVIVGRVFEQPYPQLLTASEIGLVAGDDADAAAAIRIALLWDELSGKLDRTPTAALGLLDIANSGKVRSDEAIELLAPALASAVRRASTDLPDTDAWDFLGAIATKMRTREMRTGKEAVTTAAELLAARSPEGATAFLVRPQSQEIAADLLPPIAHGLGDSAEGRSESALLRAPPELLLRLVASDGQLTGRVAANRALVEQIGEALRDQDSSLINAVSARLLPHLIEDWQLPAARPLVLRLNGKELAEEVAHLGAANDFEATGIAELVVERARVVSAKQEVRASILSAPESPRRDALLAKTIDPAVDDIEWLLRAPALAPELATSLLIALLRAADDRHLSRILSEPHLRDEVLVRVKEEASDILVRAIFSCELPVDAFVRVVSMVLPATDAATKVSVSGMVLRRCLPTHFDGNEVRFLTEALGVIGDKLDGGWAVRAGLGPGVPASVMSRNMVAFGEAPASARLRIVSAIADLAQTLCDRRTLDLDRAASNACAHLIFEAETEAPSAMLYASGRLLPLLMRQHHRPVSRIVAATFPVVYRELAKAEDVPDLLKFVPFLDWDRCKAARHELVSTFISSPSWTPADLALTACRCGDIDKILRRTAKSYGGKAYTERIAHEVGLLPTKCRSAVQRAISDLSQDSLAKFDWRD